MKKREFLKLTGIVGVGVAVSPFMACNSGEAPASEAAADPNAAPAAQTPGFELPALTFGTAELEPNIDAQTMEIHHSKHHAGYVRKLNAALEGNYNGESLVELCAAANMDNAGVRNNGGGHYNHTLFWEVIAPGGGDAPAGALGEAMMSTFGSMEAFEEQFFTAAKTRFGSGWAWLSVDDAGKLFVSSTPNQDNPLMAGLVDMPGTPIMGVDVWEHAYYLNYQNQRGRYIKAFQQLVNWDAVAARYAAIS